MQTICIIVAVSAAIAAGILTLQQRGWRLRTPWATLAIAAVVLGVSVAGELDHGILNALCRDIGALRAGEWWRAFTPLLVQDGGWPGLAFNVLALVAIGALVESLLPRWVVPVGFVATGLLAELAAYTVMRGQGFAGNSVANLGLAALVLVAALRSSRVPARLAGGVGMLAGAVLLLTWDLHAAGILAGTLLALALWSVHRAEPARAEPARTEPARADPPPS
ncbi:MAG: rhomboid family intramembrane serine protease [Schumannella sp.]